jgi:predicted AlkP superfamily phosphohydrolase/phosphomutase
MYYIRLSSPTLADMNMSAKRGESANRREIGPFLTFLGVTGMISQRGGAGEQPVGWGSSETVEAMKPASEEPVSGADRHRCVAPVRLVRWMLPAALAIVLFDSVEPAHAYVGPGAGIAIGTTLFTVFIAFFSAMAALISWPFRWAIRMVRMRKAHAKARVKRVVVLGLDGLESSLVEKYMDEGKLPNFARLRDNGTYRRLGTTLPAMTPVAWATFLTGCNPGKHNIFDFLTRDKRNYLPMLSSTQIEGPRKTLELGKYRIPLGKPDVRLLRKGKPFWNTLSDYGIFSNIIRMPITFPPEKFRGVLLSAMSVPDLRGTQGTFSYYSSNGQTDEEHIGGEQFRVEKVNGVVRSYLVGPENTIVKDSGEMRCPFEARMAGPDAAVMKIAGETVNLKRGEYSPWVKVKFKAGLGIKVRGICQFLLLETEPNFKLYVTPIQIDPASPVLPIAHPQVYSTYLARMQGSYATMGLAEDTWGLNAKVLDDKTFLHQCDQVDDERIVMFHDALEKVPRGLVACVVDGPDRIHHMFWRYLDPKHPAHAGQGGPEIRDAIEEMYVRMDGLIGDTLAKCDDPNTMLIVMSDHGCASFRRGIDLNRWLEQEGYLVLKEDGRGQKYLQGVDWSRTKAYCLGLSGLWLNIRGREAQGIVEPADAAPLRAEIVGKLTGLKDEKTGEVAVNRVFEAARVYRGPYTGEAPDLLVGYNDGYRVSWEAAIGQPTDEVFHDNMKAWSGDHCIDPALVPGVLFCNRKIDHEKPHIKDLAPTILRMFGVEVPKNMDGQPLKVADAHGVFPDAGEPEPEAAVAG